MQLDALDAAQAAVYAPPVHQPNVGKHVLWVVGPALGHVSRSLLVARELKKQGVESRFLGSDVHGFHGRLVGSGEFPYRDLQLPNTEFERFADEVASHVNESRPLAVVFDCSPTPWRLVMPALPVPTVYLSNGFLLEPGANTHQKYVWERFGEIWQALRIQRGLEPITDPLQLYDCDLMLLADPAAVLPHAADLPAHHRHVGACAWAPDLPLPPELEYLENVLFVSMGSTGRPVPPDLIERLAVACSADNIVKMASGGSLEVNGVALQLGDVPGPALLARSCFALTHGGAGSSYQALSSGVPVAVWPSHHNHRVLGRKLQELGIGVVLDAARYVEQIEALALDIDAVSDRALRMRFDLSEGPRTAARVIKEYLVDRGTSVTPIQTVLIVGCQRSGTTLLGQILGAHPNAVLIDEDDGATALALALCESGSLDPDLLRAALLKARAKYREGGRITADGEVACGITHLVLKAPNATYDVEALQQLAQPPSLLFAVRDARDVVASIARLPHISMVANQARRIRANPAAARRFSADLERLEYPDLAGHLGSAIVWQVKNSYYEAFASAPLNAMLVRYEDVVSDTSNARERIYRHVGLPQPTQLGHEDVMRGMGPGLTSRARPVDAASMQRWQRSLTPMQEEEIWAETGDLMRTLGYVRTPASRPESTVSQEVLASPIIVTGRGGSGTRLLSVVLQQLGVFMGNRLNQSADSIEWVDLIYEMAIKRLAANRPASDSWKGELHARAAGVLEGGPWTIGTRWGWKLPESMLVLPELAEAHPGAQFIHLVRDPLDTCLRRTHMTSRTGNPIGDAALAAAYRQLDWQRSPAQDPDHLRNAASWVMQVGAMRAHVATSGHRCLELTYEQLIGEPQSAADRVAEFLGMETATVDVPVDFNRARQWSPGDPRVTEVWEICGEVASFYGYRLPGAGE